MEPACELSPVLTAFSPCPEEIAACVTGNHPAGLIGLAGRAEVPALRFKAAARAVREPFARLARVSREYAGRACEPVHFPVTRVQCAYRVAVGWHTRGAKRGARVAWVRPPA
jgi:hypothetical protein